MCVIEQRIPGRWNRLKVIVYNTKALLGFFLITWNPTTHSYFLVAGKKVVSGRRLTGETTKPRPELNTSLEDIRIE